MSLLWNGLVEPLQHIINSTGQLGTHTKNTLLDALQLMSFASLDFAGKTKRTKRDVFLAEMAAMVRGRSWKH